MGRLGEVDLLEFEDVLGRVVRFVLGVLRLGLELDLGGVLDDALDGDLDEVVEGVELLADEALLVEVGRDDEPARFLPEARVDVVVVYGLIAEFV
jgi:hypothetical protein